MLSKAREPEPEPSLEPSHEEGRLEGTETRGIGDYVPLILRGWEILSEAAGEIAHPKEAELPLLLEGEVPAEEEEEA